MPSYPLRHPRIDPSPSHPCLCLDSTNNVSMQCENDPHAAHGSHAPSPPLAQTASHLPLNTYHHMPAQSLPFPSPLQPTIDDCLPISVCHIHQWQNRLPPRTIYIHPFQLLGTIYFSKQIQSQWTPYLDFFFFRYLRLDLLRSWGYPTSSPLSKEPIWLFFVRQWLVHLPYPRKHRM